MRMIIYVRAVRSLRSGSENEKGYPKRGVPGIPLLVQRESQEFSVAMSKKFERSLKTSLGKNLSIRTYSYQLKFRSSSTNSPISRASLYFLRHPSNWGYRILFR